MNQTMNLTSNFKKSTPPQNRPFDFLSVIVNNTLTIFRELTLLKKICEMSLKIIQAEPKIWTWSATGRYVVSGCQLVIDWLRQVFLGMQATTITTQITCMNQARSDSRFATAQNYIPPDERSRANSAHKAVRTRCWSWLSSERSLIDSGSSEVERGEKMALRGTDDRLGIAYHRVYLSIVEMGPSRNRGQVRR